MESISSGITHTSCLLNCQKMLHSQSHRNCSVHIRKVFWIAVDQSSHNGPLPEGEIHQLTCFFFLNSSIFNPSHFPFPSSLSGPEGLLSREQEIPVSPKGLVIGTQLTCCSFPKPFPDHGQPSSLARVSAMCST